MSETGNEMARQQKPQRADNSAHFRERLTEWLRQKSGNPALVIESLSEPGDAGFSNETYLIDIRAAGRLEQLVVRREPAKAMVFVGKSFEAQFRLMQALHAEGSVPVPEALWLETDRAVLGGQFYVMRRLPGVSAPDNPPFHAGGWIASASVDERQQVWWSGVETLARIHRIDAQAAGLQFLRPADGRTPLEDEIRYFDHIINLKPDHPYCSLTEQVRDWLLQNMPEEPELSLCWGDARPANMLFQGWRCVGVLDWEMATLGAAEKDFAYWLFLDHFVTHGFGIQPLPGWPAPSETLQRYEHLLGRPLRNMPYYTVLAAYRALGIFIRFVAAGLAPGLPEDQCPGSIALREAWDRARRHA